MLIFQIYSQDCISHSCGYFVHPIRANIKVYKGPGNNYPVDFILTHKCFPLKVIASFGIWRKVQDFENSTGWIHQSSLAQTPKMVITKKRTCLWKSHSKDSKVMAEIEPGCIARFLKNKNGWYLIHICYDREKKKFCKGWVEPDAVWGIH